MTPPDNIIELMEQMARADLRTKQALAELAEGQVRTDKVLADLMRTLAESRIETDKALADLMRTSEAFAANVNRYVDAADARMKRIEENLDALIRAITSEHSNGKAR